MKSPYSKSLSDWLESGPEIKRLPQIYLNEMELLGNTPHPPGMVLPREGMDSKWYNLRREDPTIQKFLRWRCQVFHTIQAVNITLRTFHDQLKHREWTAKDAGNMVAKTLSNRCPY